jgi:hypothetical protein
MEKLNPHARTKDTSPSPGALIEGISGGYKAKESEKQATSNLMSQRNSTIALRQRQQQLYYSQKLYSPVLSNVDPAEAAERSHAKAITLASVEFTS